jgi:hypothetical protein
MSLRDKLLGKTPKPPVTQVGGGAPPTQWEDIATSKRELGGALRRTWDALMGNPTTIRICPVCRRKVESGENTCPKGHVVT